MGYIKRFLRQDRDYFNNNGEDIRSQNRKVLRVACIVYLLILAVYTVITALLGKSPLLSWLYYIYDAIHIALCIVVFWSKPGKLNDSKSLEAVRVIFEIALLSFFAIEASLPFPEQHSIYFPFPIILLVMVFTYRAKYAFALALSYVAAFITLSCIFKTGAARVNDIYIAVGTLISAGIGYAITASLRHETSDAMGRLRSLSMTDPLTGLYNKQTFESLCRTLVEDEQSERSYAMLFIDIDKFKQINDRFGHQMGDSVLKSVAGVMKGSFYDKDYLCRFGGDEFVVFMLDVESEAVVVEQVRRFKEKVGALAKTLKTDDLSCSVGIAMKWDRPETFSELLSRADAALYVIKRGGDQRTDFAEQYYKQGVYMDANARFVSGSQPALPEFPESAKPKGKRSVLIADDNEINRRLLHKILSRDYEVLEAGDGKQALDILDRRHQEISAVLLDIVMPVMDGYAVLEAMRGDERLATIPVIVTTGNTEEETEVRALSLGANDFVIKPYRPEVIMHRVRNTIKLRETSAIVNAAEKDALTGVCSKDFFYERAQELIGSHPAGYYDMVCCDIENFKLINELFGKKTADELLKYVATLLVQAEMMNEGVCGRIGSDRFASLVRHRDEYSQSDFEMGMQRINEFPITFNISVCHGIYVVDDTSVPVSTMCDRALTACNSIKGQYGVYYAYYDDTFRKKALSEQFILDGMDAALHEHQFKVYYQPKYDLATEQIVGAEALVRWLHPEKGFMKPAEFIPLFEQNGFITDLDIYVWETACRDISEWMVAGEKLLPISVNLSRKDIYNPNLPDIICDITERFGVEPQYLHLEITETAYTQNSVQLIDVVKKLRALGFLIEMDDFGSGYSSLNILSELPIDILKLDMSLISETARSQKRNILEVITYLAGQLRLPVVAEGVETTKQVTMLRELNCNYVQGYYFAKPMPRSDYEDCLKQTKTIDS